MDDTPQLPIAVSYIGSKYLLFDIDVVTWLRRTHHICGIMTGTLPQSPSQNLFLGLPVQIMPEEAQLLVDKGVAYIVDDIKAHDHAFKHSDATRQASYLSKLRQEGEKVSLERDQEKEEARRQSMKQKPKPGGKSKSKTKKQEPPQNPSSTQTEDNTEETLFDSTSTIKPSISTQPSDSITNSTPHSQPHNIVPTISGLWLNETSSETTQASPANRLLPGVPPSYHLYKHLNSKACFMTPGLRFGCQYTVYPGDPLRFHSHFLAVGKEWDEEIELMDLVGGGRLGTGVKKGFLIGGLEPRKTGNEMEAQGKEKEEDKVRTFCFEWAAM